MVAPEKFLSVIDHGGFLTLLHARTAAFLLHSFGSDVSIRGLLLALPSGTVEVQEACSGLLLMLLLLKIGLMTAIAFPLRGKARIMICGAALACGFVVGVARIALLAALVQNADWFARMHGPAGMNFFSAIGFLIYAPFLLPAEKPFADLLRKLRRQWDSAPPRDSRHLRLPLTALIGAGFTFALLKDVWIPSANSSLMPVRSAAAESGEAVPVPADLRSARFNAVRSASCSLLVLSGTSRTTLFCQVSGALSGPEEVIRDPRLAAFISARFKNNPPFVAGPFVRVGEYGVVKTPHGEAGVYATDACGHVFFSTAEFNAAQRATFAGLQTWKEWLLTGRPLKDTRYRLVVFVDERGGLGENRTR